MLVVMTLITLAALPDDGVSLKFLPSGATAKVGGYRPIRAEMTDKAEGVKKAPEGLAAPKYGELKFGDKSWRFILDEPEGKPARLFVDSNGDGDTGEILGTARELRGPKLVDFIEKALTKKKGT